MLLWMDTSVAADAEAAMALLSQQSAEEKSDKPHRAEEGFLGSVLLGTSLPVATAGRDPACAQHRYHRHLQHGEVVLLEDSDGDDA